MRRPNSKTCIALATSLAISASIALDGQAFDWDLNPFPSRADKAAKQLKKAELEAKNAQYRAEYAQREADRLKLEAENAKAQAEVAKKQAAISSQPEIEQKKAKVETPKNENRGFDLTEAKARAEYQGNKAPESEYIEDVTREAESPTEQTPAEAGAATDNGFSKNQVQKTIPVKKHRSFWNPLSWFDGNAVAADESEKPTVMMAQADEPKEEKAAGKIRLSKKEEAEAVNLPEGISQEDAKYYQDAKKFRAAEIDTQRGTISIELYPDAAPVTVTNFVKLAETGFYNQTGMKFHRVVPGFVVQTGDPTGTGAGGSKDRIPLEVKNRLSHDGKGVVAMARGASINSATSQFYITLAPQKTLDAKYAIFGRVMQGYDALTKIGQDDRLYGVKLVDVNTLTKEDPDANTKQSFLKKIF